MQQQYSDLRVTSATEQKTIGDKRCYEIDYGYTVSGYEVKDRRVIITAGETTYMFASKEIESNGMMIGSMLDDVVADCELLGPDAERVLVDSEFMLVTGLSEMRKALNNGAAIESVYYTDGYGFSVSEFTTTDPDEMKALWIVLRRRDREAVRGSVLRSNNNAAIKTRIYPVLPLDPSPKDAHVLVLLGIFYWHKQKFSFCSAKSRNP